MSATLFTVCKLFSEWNHFIHQIKIFLKIYLFCFCTYKCQNISLNVYAVFYFIIDPYLFIRRIHCEGWSHPSPSSHNFSCLLKFAQLVLLKPMMCSVFESWNKISCRVLVQGSGCKILNFSVLREVQPLTRVV